MASENIKVLIINRQLGFSVRIKQALEQLGGFEVAPFTAAAPALEYLAKRRHDVALVDFTIPDQSGSDMVYMLRQIQPGIAIVASPDLPDVVTEARGLDIHGVVDVPAGARDIAPVLLNAVGGEPEIAHDTMEAPPYEEEHETTMMESAESEQVVIRATMPSSDIQGEDDSSGDVELIIRDSKPHDLSDLADQFEQLDEALQGGQPDKASQVFNRLAEEEPPMPTLEDTGTVSDLRTGVTSAHLYELAESIVEEQSRQIETVDDHEAEAGSEPSSPVRIILESTQRGESIQEGLHDLLENIERQFPEDASGVSPLPSWIKDVERYVREPDFLEDALPKIDDQQESSTTTTVDDVDKAVESITGSAPRPDLLPEEGVIEDSVEEISELTDEEAEAFDHQEVVESAAWLSEVNTDDLDAQLVTEPDTAQPDESPDEVSDRVIEEAGADLGPEIEPEWEPEPEFELEPEREMQITPEPVTEPELESAYEAESLNDTEIAQLAISLTRAALESTAAAILLVKGSEVVAYAGDLPLEDMAQLHTTIAGDWNAKPGEARVRFTTLPESGLDYMLYSRQTGEDYTLSMVFEGTLPLRSIRQQSDKILDALMSVPEDVETQTEEELQVIDDLYNLEDLAAQEEEAAVQSTQELLVQQSKNQDVEEPPPSPVPSRQIVVPQIPETKVEEFIRYTFVWMLRDPSRALGRKAAQALVLRLDEWLTSIGWQVEILQVYEDYVYLMADVPDEQPVQEIIMELKRFSAEIVSQFDMVKDRDLLWAESYGYLEPGRPLTQEEIQQFISFERM